MTAPESRDSVPAISSEQSTLRLVRDDVSDVVPVDESALETRRRDTPPRRKDWPA
jgi:hypothetical protein